MFYGSCGGHRWTMGASLEGAERSGSVEVSTRQFFLCISRHCEEKKKNLFNK
jgi:hypothetical protein